MAPNRRKLAAIAFVACSLSLCARTYNALGQNNSNQNNNGYDNNRNGNQGNYNGGDYGRSTLPAGTQINVRLDRSENGSGNGSGTQQGDLIQATLVDDVSSNDRVVAPSGSRVQLRVDSGSSDRRAYRLDSMTANGQFYRLSSNAVSLNDRFGQNGGNNDNRSGAQKLGDFIGGDNNRNADQNDRNQRYRNGGQVLSFRLTSPARPQRNR